MVGRHHRLNGHEFEQAPEDSEGQKRLMCCIPWGHKELDMTEMTELYVSRLSLKNDSYMSQWRTELNESRTNAE